MLDLDETDFSATSLADDLVLDLDFEESAPPQQTIAIEDAAPAPVQADHASVTTHEEVMSAEQPAIVIESAEVVNAAINQDQAQSPSIAEALSSQTIDAIARRVMDQMSDRVVREIAWEVVPELSELLIRKKLNEQK